MEYTDVAFVKVSSDRNYVEVLSSTGNYFTRIAACQAKPIVSAMIQGDRIVVQGANGRIDIFDANSCNYIMSC